MLDGLDDPAVFEVRLSPRDDYDRARRILRKAVLEINDRVAELYDNGVMPPRVSESERENYRG